MLERRWARPLGLLVAGGLCVVAHGRVDAATTATESVVVRGKSQALHTYGARGPLLALVASGDGGWIHLGPEMAEFLAAKGYFVVGLDSKAYLSSFTDGAKTLTTEDVPNDFGTLIDYVRGGAAARVLLVGVSEGAALAVLAAADERVKPKCAGVLGLGLPDQAELGWRFRDSIIYVTKGVPKEPLFSTAAFSGRVAPLPLAAIQSTHDEFVPQADIERVMAGAGEPKRLWMVEAPNHRFGGKEEELQQRVVEALEWILREHR